MNGNSKWVQWVIGVLLLIFMAISGWTANKIDTVSKETVQTRQYDREYGTLCDRLNRMEDKIDKILDHLPRK